MVSFHHVPCGHCFYCERRLFSQCPAYKKVGLTAGFDPNGGGFAEYVRAMPWIAERGMVAIPDGRELRGSHVRRAGEHLPQGRREGARGCRRNRVVMGQGPIGLLLMMLAQLGRRHGARQRSDAGAPRR